MAKKKKAPEAGENNRAVIYARYSPGPNQRDESIEGQVRECKETAKRHGLVVIHEYVDKRMTGTNDERPDFQRMLRDAERGLFDFLIVWKMDRFARNRFDSAINKAKLRKAGVKLIYAKEHIPDGPEGIILESMLEGMAEYYSANLAQNIRRGQRENALDCKFIGGTIPLGYKLDSQKHYVIDPETAPVVREIFERYTAGESVVTICQDLNERGFQTARKGDFNRSSLHRILANEKYTGMYRFEDIENPDGVPRIISNETFKAAAERIERNKKSKRNVPTATEKFILTGKVFCGHCGQPMGGTWGTSRNGSRYSYYICNGKRAKACHKKPERKEALEEKVTNCVINNILKNDEVVNYIIDRCMLIQEKEADFSTADGLRRELAEAEKSLKNVMAAIEAGIITPTTKDRLMELEERCANLRQGIAAAEIVPPKLSRDQLLFLFEKYQNRDVADPVFFQDIVDTFIDKIYVYDDKVVITFNYSDERTREVTLSQVDEALGDNAPHCSTVEASTPPYVTQSNTKFFFIEDFVFGVCLYSENMV